MSKRGAGNWGGDEERYGGGSGADMDGSDKPVQATAAQLARRKLLKPKARSDRGRSDSPAVQPQNAFGQAAPNPFVSQGFNFTAQQPQQSNGTAFQFGQSQPASANPAQQNGTSNIFSQSSAPSFGGFGSTAPQSQQNGFNASSSLFNQPSQQSSTPSFTGFGQSQSQQSQQNGTTTPATSFGGFSNASQPNDQNGTSMTSNIFGGFGAKPTEANDKAASPFPSFGQKPQENGAPASNGFGFGQPAQENASSRASTPAFGGTFGQKAPEQTDKPANTLFGQKPEEKAEQNSNPFASFGQKPAESSNKPTNPFAGFNGFSQKPAESTPAPSETPKASSNMFGQPPATQPAQPATPSTGLFGSKPIDSSTAPGTGLFGAKQTTNEPAKSGGSIFDNLPKKDSSALKFNFSSADPSQVYNGEDDEDEGQGATVHKASESQPVKTNPFAGFGQSQQATKPSSTMFGQSTQAPSLFGNNATQQDTSMNTPSATPQKSLFSSTTPAAIPAVSSTPAAQPPRSLFDRINNPQTEETPKAPLFSTTPAPATAAKPLFQSSNVDAGSKTPAAAPSLFQKRSEDDMPRAAPTKNIFAQSAAAPSTPAAAPTAAASSFKATPATASVAHTLPPPAPATTKSSITVSPTQTLDESQQKSMKALNEGLLAHLKTQRPDTDWSPVYRYALTMAAQIAGRSAPSTAELNPVSAAKEVSAPSGSTPAASSNATTTSTPASSLFAQTPKAAPTAPFSSNPPATAPTKKRHFEEDADDSSRAPATEKRSKPNEPASYPKLPETASNTAKLFASTLDKPATSTGFTPSTKSLFSSTASSTATATPLGGLKPPTGLVPLGGFKPSAGDSAPSTAPASTGGFKPTFTPAAGGGSFLSSFGALAKKQEDADRQKRKDNDYDSDEETEEQWAKRDKAEQEEKRRKFEEAAKSAPSFSLGSETTKPATADAAEKSQGSGDKTWTQNTPLKFNFAGAASTTPAVAPSRLFGNTASSVGGSSTTLALPATSSLGASRATTPGATTDGASSTAANGDKANADDGEPSDEPNQPQASDEINDLQPAEREGNEVLLEVKDVRTSKMEKDEDSKKSIWVPKTRGRFFILKDKTTGKVRMLSRTGAGRTVLNHVPNKEATFKVHPKKANMIVASLFVDHLHSTPPGPGQWMFSTPDKDDAAKIAQLLTEGTPK
ncbi:Putative PH-like domain superfamily protein [Septoria linicola]|uniref:PH-like domain superfamily protein n=1 Tax=Septoria linicola TaxID=215465 RepID=A0A9Q9AWG3_9PEZI|nr:Putative PH-like domain superfamily protein [Septoria linicola]